MTKENFYRVVADKAGISIKEAKRLGGVIGETLIECMKDPEGVSPFTGMKFFSSYSEAKTGRNPQTGEPITISARYMPKAKFGKAVKEGIN